MNISQLVSKTVAMGIPPLELKYLAIRDCSSRMPIAYRTEVLVNSVEYGTLSQVDYSSVCEKNDVGIRLCEWAIKCAIREIQSLPMGMRPYWVSVPCPVSFAALPNLYNRIKRMLAQAEDLGRTQLCLEFSDKLLMSEESRIAILDLKLLKVRSLVICSGENTCSFFRLTGIPVDAILLSKDMTRMVDDRNKPDVVPSLIRYLQSMNIGVIANEPATSEQIRTFARLECEGYIQEDEPGLLKDELFDIQDMDSEEEIDDEEE